MVLTLKLNLSGPAGRLVRRVGRWDERAASWSESQHMFLGTTENQEDGVSVRRVHRQSKSVVAV